MHYSGHMTYAVGRHEKPWRQNTQYETTWHLPAKFHHFQQQLIENLINAFTNLISI
jgi:hypothetical protein